MLLVYVALCSSERGTLIPHRPRSWFTAFASYAIIKCGEGWGSLTASGDSPVPQALEVAGAEGGGRYDDRCKSEIKPKLGKAY